MMKLKKLGIVAGLSLALVACGGEDADESSAESESNGDVNVGEEVEYTITGIEPGAGISQATNKALKSMTTLRVGHMKNPLQQPC